MRGHTPSLRSVMAASVLVLANLSLAPGIVAAAGPAAAAAPAGPGTHPDRSVVLAAGWGHTCALLATGSVECWGENGAGQLGDNTTTHRSAPVAVKSAAGSSTALSGVQAIGAGANGMHTCALLGGGTVKCWGYNGEGELGDGTATDRHAPVTVKAAAGSTSALSGVQAVAVGQGHTCALLVNGTVKCWGYNFYGELGDGTTTERHTPVTVKAAAGSTTPLSGVIAVAVGDSHSCALLVGGTVRCWGANGAGGLGDGTTTDRHTPVAVKAAASGTSALGDVRAIAAGSFHTCAVLVDGTVKCWGDNLEGGLGDGTLSDRHTPVTVKSAAGSTSALLNVRAIAAGELHTCAMLASGGVKCWGAGDFGQLGDGLAKDHSTPVTVHAAIGSTAALVHVSGVVTGGSHTCALVANGTVACWGLNHGGQLGDRTTTNRWAPVTVRASATSTSALTGIGQRAIAVGFGQACALLVNGTVRCWGANFEGEVGDGTTDQRAAPVVVETSGGSSAALSNVVAIAAGGFYTCALLVDGTVRCWGGDYGLAPKIIVSGAGSSTALSNVVALTAGAHHACALLVTGTIRCWGENLFGAVGDGSNTDRSAPVVVKSTAGSASALPKVRAISAGQFHTCALLTTGTMKCWGLNAASSDPFGLWSSGGQLGDGSTTNRSTPVTVRSAAGSSVALSSVTAVAAGGLHSCALLSSGTMKCWGDNTTFGQIGDGSVAARLTPVAVRSSASSATALAGIAGIVGGQWHTCALLSVGTLKCWGANTFGQLGDGSTTARHAPVTVKASAASTSPLNGVSAVATEVYAGQDGGGDHICALLASGVVKCWGDNAYGTVGDGTTTERHAPVSVINLP